MDNRIICHFELFDMRQNIFVIRENTFTTQSSTPLLGKNLANLAADTHIKRIDLYGNKTYLQKVKEDIYKEILATNSDSDVVVNINPREEGESNG